MNWSIILAPVVGGVIGYITNDLAIKMLFHPYKSVYIGSFRVPFTPGLIPSQKDRIAKGLGSVIGGQLLNAETIRKEALNPETEEKIRAKISAWLNQQIASDESVKEKLLKVTDAEKLSGYGEKALESCTEFAVRKIESAHIGDIIAEEIIRELYEKVKGGPLGFFVDSSMLSGFKGTIAAFIDRKVKENGPDLIREKLSEMGTGILNRPVSEMLMPYQDKVEVVTDKIMALYREILENKLDDLLKAVEIEKIIERKIATFDAPMLEKLIFGIMKKELKAIVYLGAALGFLMGFINLLW
ncbi:MAG: DUF445 family protein [Clostridia bacterium]|nr:DUF445 family protein [Clostridia bacterium]